MHKRSRTSPDPERKHAFFKIPSGKPLSGCYIEALLCLLFLCIFTIILPDCPYCSLIFHRLFSKIVYFLLFFPLTRNRFQLYNACIRDETERRRQTHFTKHAAIRKISDAHVRSIYFTACGSAACCTPGKKRTRGFNRSSKHLMM